MNRAVNVTKILREVELIFERHYGVHKGIKAGFVIAYVLPDGDPHWMNNRDRSEGIEIFKATAREIKKRAAAGQPGRADIEGLDDLMTELERLFRRKLGVLPAMVVNFATPTDHEHVHWCSNVPAEVAVRLLEGAVTKMTIQLN